MGLAERALLAYTVVRTKLHVFSLAAAVSCRRRILMYALASHVPAGRMGVPSGRFAPVRETRGLSSGLAVWSGLS